MISLSLFYLRAESQFETKGNRPIDDFELTFLIFFASFYSLANFCLSSKYHFSRFFLIFLWSLLHDFCVFLLCRVFGDVKFLKGFSRWNENDGL